MKRHEMSQTDKRKAFLTLLEKEVAKRFSRVYLKKNPEGELKPGMTLMLSHEELLKIAKKAGYSPKYPAHDACRTPDWELQGFRASLCSTSLRIMVVDKTPLPVKPEDEWVII